MGRGGAVLLLGMCGCLAEGAPPPAGLHLVSGREVSAPSIHSARGRATVAYETPEAPGSPKSPLRLWLVPAAGGSPRKVADRGAWPMFWDADGTALVLHDVAAADGSPLPDWYPGWPAQAARVELESGRVLDEYAGVTDVHAWQGRLALQRQTSAGISLTVIPTAAAPAFALEADAFAWRGADELLALRRLPDRTDGPLVRLRGPGGPAEPVQPAVGGFVVHPDLPLLLTYSSPPGVRFWLADLEAAAAEPVGVPDACHSFAFRPGTRTLACRTSTAALAFSSLLVMNLDDGSAIDLPFSAQDRALLRDESVGRTEDFAWAPDGGALAIYRTHHHAWLVDLRAQPVARYLGNVAAFSPDGRHVVWARYDGGERLGVEDLDDGTVRVLTPEGATALMYFAGDPARVLFLASHGQNGFDLLDGDLRTGASHRLASDLPLLDGAHGRDRLPAQIPLVAAGDRVLVIANWSTQDRTGELMLLERASRTRTIIARGVRDFAVAPACDACAPLAPGAPLVFVTLARTASDSDGLWATAMP